eukprot:3939604-Prymnesium_polylepis.1
MRRYRRSAGQRCSALAYCPPTGANATLWGIENESRYEDTFTRRGRPDSLQGRSCATVVRVYRAAHSHRSHRYSGTSLCSHAVERMCYVMPSNVLYLGMFAACLACTHLRAAQNRASIPG